MKNKSNLIPIYEKENEDVDGNLKYSDSDTEDNCIGNKNDNEIVGPNKKGSIMSATQVIDNSKIDWLDDFPHWVEVYIINIR